ncbi:glycosyltransferase [Lentzea sp. NEAU-D13]|uniref:Glycosyltransferase n=1 Tax=Lentzea alba TaxID=2714351 RepID=A0A7C9RTW5_9PSEU|nr:glycosyltransferase [Lentzea alba]NGY61763.1 glycosyltransferase [Lentzea alba]
MPEKRADLRLRVVQSRFQNAFFHELAEAIVDEATRLGVPADVVTSVVDTEPDDVFVLLPTHEYAVLEGGQFLEDPRLAKRCIGITAEQPASSHFDTNVYYGHKLGAVFDFSTLSVKRYQAEGIAAEHLPFGWTPTWDKFVPDADEHELDVLFLGCATPRREHALSKIGRQLWSRRSRLILSDNAAPNTGDHAAFVTGDRKRELLAGTKVLVNVHQADEPYFEWLRAAEAAHCGAVMLSETSLHTEPFKHDEHLVFSALSTMPHALAALLEDPARLKRLRRNAYELIKENPFSAGVEKLVSVAHDLRKTHDGHRLRLGPSRTQPFRQQVTPSWERQTDGVDAVRQAIREIRLDIIDLRRRVSTDPTIDPTPVIDHRTPAWDRRTPRVSVIMALYNHEPYVVEALESAASGSYNDIEIIVVDDCSNDGSNQTVRKWMDKSPHVPMTLVRHPVNRGLPRSRNEAFRHARGELVFVLDSDNAIVPTGLERLVAAIDAEPDASFAYGVLQRFDSTGPVGLMGVWPWEPWRLRYGNYIDAMALIKHEALTKLEGYTLDRRLHGWEDYELWCRIAESGGHAAHVQTIVGRYRQSATSMLSLTNISQDAGFDAVRESCPRLMSGALELQVDALGDWLASIRGEREARDVWLSNWEAQNA